MKRVLQLKKQLKDGKPFAEFVKPAVEDSKDVLFKMLQVAESMDFEGLKDQYGRNHNYLRISLTEKCNFRCTYCMPEDGVVLKEKRNMLSNAERQTLVELFAMAGVDKIRLTGGEPLIRKDIGEIVSGMKSVKGIDQIGITTNGLLVKRKMEELEAAGVSHWNVSLDTLCRDKFEKVTRRRGFDRVMEGIAHLMEAGLTPRINCVVMRGLNDYELSDFVMLTRDWNVDIRFIEWMPFDHNQWNSDTFVPYSEMLDRITLHGLKDSIVKVQDELHATSKMYQVQGHRGRFGFITSMSEHFCGACNRLRLTADGNLKVCLFGAQEVSLRDGIRLGLTHTQLLSIVQLAVHQKSYSLGGHASMHEIANSKNRPMVLIGG